MTRVKSLHQNKKEGVDIPSHRTHRSKKNRRSFGNTQESRLYKEKLKYIKEKELDRDIENYSNLMAKRGKW